MEKTKTAINQDKWFQLMTDDEGTIELNKLDGLIIDEISRTHPNGTTQTLDIETTDGEIPQFTTYGKYELSVTTLFRGIDKRDVDLFVFKLNNMLSRRKPYYIRHSDLPNIKWQVKPTPKIESSKIGRQDVSITITFECNKGFSESYNSTLKMDLINGGSQFGGGNVFDNEIKYVHDKRNFDIYNGGADTLDPYLGHYIHIKISADAPNGLTIRNNTTGDELIYRDILKPEDELIINGVYVTKGNKNMGRVTNFEYLTLKKGYNSISIYGDEYNEPHSEWDFNYLYR